MEISVFSEAYIVQRVHENEARKDRVKEGGIHVGVGSQCSISPFGFSCGFKSFAYSLSTDICFGSRLVMCVMLLCT